MRLAPERLAEYIKIDAYSPSGLAWKQTVFGTRVQAGVIVGSLRRVRNRRTGEVTTRPGNRYTFQLFRQEYDNQKAIYSILHNIQYEEIQELITCLGDGKPKIATSSQINSWCHASTGDRYIFKKGKKWRTQIRILGVGLKYIGTYLTKEEAIQARDKAIQELEEVK